MPKRLRHTEGLRADLAKAIRERRHDLKLSQEELAWRAGLHRTYVADVERGGRNLSLASLEKLARALELSITSLFSFSEDGGQAGPGQAPLDILLVEDEPDDVELTLEAFKRARLKNRVRVVSDGVKALEYLASRSPSATIGPSPNLVVLLDLALPKINGITVLRAMKSDRRTRHIPVIILTASRDDRDIEECRALGAEYYITKPVEFHDFSSVASRLSLDWILTQPPSVGQG